MIKNSLPLLLTILFFNITALAYSQPGMEPGHNSIVLTEEQITSGTLMLNKLLEERGEKEDEISFKLLRETEIGSKPPPVYPEELPLFDGQKIKMIGFMTPYDSLTNMENFMLMSVPTGCFFCAPPGPLETVFIRQKDKEEYPYMYGAIEVEGTLKLWKQDTNDLMHKMFLFIIDDAEVKLIEDGEES